MNHAKEHDLAHEKDHDKVADKAHEKAAAVPPGTPTSFPSWVYSPTQPAFIVTSLELFMLLGPGWRDTPYAENPPPRPPLPLPGTVLEALLLIYALLLAQVPPTPPVAVVASIPADEPTTHRTHAAH